MVVAMTRIQIMNGRECGTWQEYSHRRDKHAESPGEHIPVARGLD